MNDVIKFRLLADSLSDNEFNVFLSKLFNKFNKRQLILTSLFHLFNAQNRENQKKQTSNDQLLVTTDIISSIVKSRKMNDKQRSTSIATEQNKTLIPISITNLPSDIIGFCASFLEFDDYNSFQRCSRQIFIGCNDPNTISCIDNSKAINKLLESQQLTRAKYPKLNHVAINISTKFIPHTPISSNITSVALINRYRASGPAPLRPLLNSKMFHFDKIRKLRLANHYCSAIAEEPDIQNYVKDFCDMLLKFSNIDFLQLRRMNMYCSVRGGHNILITHFENDRVIKNVLQKLEGLCLRDTDEIICNLLLHHKSDQLTSLHIDKNIAAPIKGLSKLQEVCIFNTDYNKIHNVTKTAKNLKRVLLRFNANDINGLNQHFKKALENVLADLLNQHTLEFIGIGIDKDIEIVRNALGRMDMTQRDALKIHFDIYERTGNIKEYYDILRKNLSMNCHDYVLRFDCVLTEDMKDNVTLKDNVDCADNVRIRVIDTNADCKFNGYMEKWTYWCDCNNLKL